MIPNISNLIGILFIVLILGYLLNRNRPTPIKQQHCFSSIEEHFSSQSTVLDEHELIVELKKRLDRFSKRLQTKHGYSNECIENIKDRFNISAIQEKYKGGFIESITEPSGSSYTVGKGQKIVMCTQGKNDKTDIDINTLVFVALHELSHVCTTEIGHTQVFWDNFKFLLQQAIQEKIYIAVDYNQNPIMYCGDKITESPLF